MFVQIGFYYDFMLRYTRTILRILPAHAIYPLCIFIDIMLHYIHSVRNNLNLDRTNIFFSVYRLVFFSRIVGLLFCMTIFIHSLQFSPNEVVSRRLKNMFQSYHIITVPYFHSKIMFFTGQYSLVEPDGSVRTVDYTADPVNGNYI